MKRFFVAALIAASSVNVDAQLVINEIMQSNIDCVMDDINEFPDSWVELYNGGTTAVNLTNYAIGNEDDAEKAWHLPNRTVAAGGRVLVYCDKEETEMHTPFRLESGKGCAVYLFKGNQVVDKIEGLKKQPAPNIAYGRKTDGEDKWGYMATPTPNAANCGETVKDLLGEPVFSRKGCVMENGKSFTLELSLPEGSPEAEIRYTLDGSEPTRTSYLYSKPIQIGSTKIVRAKLFANGMLSPRSTTESYIFFPRKVTLPVISIATNSKYFYDNKLGIYVDGTYSKNKKNYEYNWRRPINIEIFFDKEKESELNQLCETRIMGGATRGNPLKSLAIYANKRFGEKRFDYEFFPDQRPGVKDFKSLALRNAGNDFDYLYMRDAIIQRTAASNLDIDWQAWRPAIVYINGTYKGMLNIRERSNEDNIYTNYDGLEDIDMFENWYELKSGTWDNYDAFKVFYNEHGHTMDEYEKWMDTMEFLNLMLVNLFYNNRDFPGNNIVMWRPRTEDGRWRWIMKDTDFGLGLYNTQPDYNTIAWVNNHDYDSETSWANNWDHTRLFRRLMEDKDFKREFVDRAAIYMGDFLNERGTRKMWDPMYEMIRYEYPNHRKLFNQWWPNYDEELKGARNFIALRANYFYKYVADYYGLGTPMPLTVNKSLTDDERGKMEVKMNGVRLSEALFDGKFYNDRELTVSSDSPEVKGWRVTVLADGKQDEKTVEGSVYSFKMPQCTKMAIEAILDEGTLVKNIYDTEESSSDIISLSGTVVRKNATSSEGLPSGIYLWKGRKIVCQ